MKEILKTIGERRHLTRAEASEAMRMIMDGEASDAQIGALLMGLRLKDEQPEELLGFVETMRRKSVKVNVRDPRAVDLCGTGGDGRQTFNISTIAAFVVAGAGVTVAKHGNRAISSRCGSADVLQELGVDVACPPAVVERSINEIGIGFLFAPLFHPAMKHAARARTDLAVKTCFNLLGPLTNPAGVRRQVIGTFSRDAAALIARVLTSTDAEHVIVLTSEDGMDEISLAGPAHLFSLRNGAAIEESVVHPDSFGLPGLPPDAARGGSPAENARIARRVLDGEKGPERSIVLANAALGILVAGTASTLREAVAVAAEAIDTGRAAEKLRLLAEASRS